MVNAWEEIESQIKNDDIAWELLMRSIIECSYQYETEALIERRDKLNELKRKVRNIANEAEKLSDLLADYQKTANKLGYTAADIFDPFDLFLPMFKKAASRYQDGFDDIKHMVDSIMYRFDSLRYYPDMGTLLRTMAEEARDYDPQPTFTEIAFREVSPRWFIANLVKHINTAKHCGQMPTKFRLSNKALVALTNTMLALPEPYSEKNIKSEWGIDWTYPPKE